MLTAPPTAHAPLSRPRPGSHSWYEGPVSDLISIAAPSGTMLLHRFSVTPRHLHAWLALWPSFAGSWSQAGFALHRLFVETDAEPKVTLLASHPDSAATALAAVPAVSDEAVPHVFRNVLTRPVRVEVLTHATPTSIEGRIAIMRRYSIVGGWPAFLAIWRRVVAVREAYGFRCLFAVSDEPADLFSWAFDFAGTWEDFPRAQHAYYRDPERIALRGVFDHMADYSIHPARQFVLGRPDDAPARDASPTRQGRH